MRKLKYFAVFVYVVALFLVGFSLYKVVIESDNIIIHLDGFDKSYNRIANEYRFDPFVLDVVNLCENSDFKSKCVYENTPLHFNYNRKEDRRALIPPSELSKNGIGVCRDIAVYRMAILRDLNVLAFFYYQPGHVYVVTMENDRAFRLDNNYFVPHNVDIKREVNSVYE